MAFLEVDHVAKVYESNGSEVAALRGVTFSAGEGEWIAITGRSGCGKSTLLHLCGAMDFPTGGTVRVGGVATTGLSDDGLTRLRREQIGFIFQSFQLLQTLSVVENVEAPLLLSGARNTRPMAMQRLEWVGLDSYANRLPSQLSGGQQQRVAIARALANGPSLILADEPTGNLDTGTGDSILQLLRGLANERKMAILMATHSLEAAASADRVIRMRDGLLE